MISNRIMKVLEKLMYGVLLNVLWLLGSVVGFIILGLGPSTISLGKTMQKKELFQENGELIKIIKEFARNYKENFISSNIVFLVSISTIVILYLNFIIIQHNEILFSIFYIPILLMIVYIISATTMAIPISLFANGSKREKIRLIILTPMLNISTTIFNIVFLILISLLVVIAPIGIFLIYGSLFVFAVVKINIYKLTKKNLLL